MVLSSIEVVGPGNKVSWLVSKDRLWLIFWVLVYGGAIVLGHERYLAVEQAFWGFNQPEYGVGALLVAFTFLACTAAFLPLHFQKPSSLFIYAIYFFVYVPSLIVAMLNYHDSLSRYFWLFFNFSLGIVVCCVAVRAVAVSEQGAKRPSSLVIGGFLAGAAICFITLYSTYGAILSFSGLDQIYQQREAGAATSLFIGYCQVYLAYVFSPGLFATGFIYKRFFLLFVGFCGFVFMYMITAERTVLLLPFVIALLVMMFRWRGFGARNTRGLFIAGVLLVTLVALFSKSSSVLNQIGFYFFTRLIAGPGLLVSQYYDFFSVEGYTQWAHISVIGSLVDIPAAYAGDDKWPAIGKILAERLLGIQSQSNASFIATDGVAGFGNVGVLIICLLYTLWMLVLDRVSQGWDKLFLLAALFPLAFVTTNGSIFTALTSFGGALWILVLWLDKFRFRFVRR